jgi:transglutaminase/protease-like cytokinesis protein 3
MPLKQRKMSTSHLKRKYLEECEAEVMNQVSQEVVEYRARCNALSLMETIREKANEEIRLARQTAVRSLKRKRGE